MTIPEDIKEIYCAHRDWQKRIEAMHATESHAYTYNVAKGSADAIQWAVAQAMSFEDLFLDTKRPDGTITDWLAEADAALMESVIVPSQKE